MVFDIKTIAFIQSLILATQAVALFVQFRINRSKQGVGWWLAGSILLALGFVFSSLLGVKPVEVLARIANPLIVAGHILLYIGIIRFFGRQERRKPLVIFYSVFCLVYYYYMFVENDITGRVVVVSVSIATIALMTSWRLIFNRPAILSNSADFTAVFFAVDGVFLMYRAVATLIMSPIQSYTVLAQTPIHVIAYIIPIVASTLWTFGFIIMVNQRLNEENREEKEQLKMIFNTSPDAASITRLSDGVFVDVNAGFLNMGGCTRSEIIGKSSLEDIVWNTLSDRAIYIAEMKEKGLCENLEFIFKRKDGSTYTGLVSGRIIFIGNQPHIYSVVRDITERKRTEAALIESEAMYRSILRASPDDITITDLDGNILLVSQAAKKLFGYEDDFEGFTAMKFADFIVPEDLERAISNIRRIFTGEYVKPNEYRGIRKDGSIFDIEVNSGLVRGVDGKPTKIIIIGRDVSARKQAEQQIQMLVRQLEVERNAAQLTSMTDSLTGMANRRYFDEALYGEFSRLKRSGSPLTLIMLDVDHFKKFNDTYGHLAGDDCLRRIGMTLKAAVGRSPDIVARYGGEEFTVILPETDHFGAVSIAERIRKAVEALAIPHVGSDTTSHITVSLGVVTIQTTELSAPEQIVAMADEAMYRAKQAGRNRICYAGELSSA